MLLTSYSPSSNSSFTHRAEVILGTSDILQPHLASSLRPLYNLLRKNNYFKLEKGLACVFGIRRFHSYLFWHRFELITDHKPLLGLLKEDQATSQHASARIKRWSLFLAAYEYTSTFRNTQAHANADALSRLPLPEEPAQSTTPPEVVLLMDCLDDLPVTANDIRVETRKDPVLSKVYQCVLA